MTSSWLAALLLGVRIGAAEGPDPAATMYQWEIEYQTGSVLFETYTTPIWQLEFTPRPYRRWRARHNVDGGPMGEWSEWFPADPFAGDSTGDCSVGAADLSAIGLNWARQCP